MTPEFVTADCRLIRAIGLEKAIILQRILDWTRYNERREAPGHFHDGRWWCWNTIAAWHRELDWFGQRTIERHLAELKTMGLVVTGQFSKDPRDRTTWYSPVAETIGSAILAGSTPRSLAGCTPPDLAVCTINQIQSKTDPIPKDITPPLPAVGTVEVQGVKYIADPCVQEGQRFMLREDAWKKRTPKDLEDCKLVGQPDFDGMALLQLAQDWADRTKASHPWLKPEVKTYAEALGKTMRATGLNMEGMRAVFDFIPKDEFLAQNCVSPVGLLAKWKNGLRKIDNILVKMKGDKTTKQSTIEERLKAKGAKSLI